MQIRHYAEISKEIWDSFVYGCRCGHTYFLHDMTALPMPRRLSMVYKNMSFGIFDDNDNLQMIFQLFVRFKKNKPLRMFSKQHVELSSFHGMCVKDDLTAKQYKECKKVFENYMDSFYLKYKCHGLAIALPAFSEYARPENLNMINPLIWWNFSPLLGYTYIIDLHKSESEIFAEYAQTTRNLLKRILNNNPYKILESDCSINDYDTLCNLNEECYKNQSADNKLTTEYLSALWDVIKNNEYCKCYFLYENEKAIGYVILLSFKDTIYYFWGGGTHDTQNAQRYLLHSLIQKSKEDGFKWFEVGAALPWVRCGKDKNISDYKKSFSSTIHPIYKGVYQMPPK